MNIAGMGILFSRGSGTDTFDQALRSGWQPPASVDTPRVPGGKRSVYVVDLNSVPDKTLLKKIRRADKLSKMAVAAASDALQSNGGSVSGQKLGIIVATAFGAHATTFGFLDDILDYGDSAVSPTTFSNSVHNAAASYIASSLAIKGPTLTVTQFRFSFPAALQLAKAWLDQGRCDQVLVGAVDQYGDVLGYASDQKLTPAPDGRIKPFSFKPTCHVPGEGAVFFLVGGKGESTFGKVDAIQVGDRSRPSDNADVDIIAADGMLADESAYRTLLSSDVPAAGYAPIYGSVMTGSAFAMAAGALMLKNQVLYASPVQENPLGLRLVERTEATPITSVRCLDCDCYGESSTIVLSR